MTTVYAINETQLKPEVRQHIERQKLNHIKLDTDLIGEDSRTQFMAWADERGFCLDSIWSSHGEPFEREDTQLAWDIWQASRAYMIASN